MISALDSNYGFCGESNWFDLGLEIANDLVFVRAIENDVLCVRIENDLVVVHG